MAEQADDSVAVWQNKCKDLEKIVKTLSSHCFKLVEKHEELLKKYKENEQQYNQLADRLKTTEEQLAKMGKLYEPVYNEYEKIKNKFEIEMECRHHAEEYASKISRENRNLRRMSQMVSAKHGVSLVEFNLESENSENKDTYEEYLETLNQKISDLKEENSQLTAELKKFKEDYQIEKDKKLNYSKQNERLKTEVKQVKHSLQQYEAALANLSKASDLAFQEYEKLKGSYEKEILCRDQAEKYASTLFAEKEAAKRQSTMLLMEVASDRKLMKAMVEIEDLTRQLEQQKRQYEEQMSDLKEELTSLKDQELLTSLEQENQQLLEERGSLQTQLARLESQINDLRSQYTKLSDEYENIEKRLEEATRPPPPPPPPPLPPPTKKLGLFGRRDKKKAAAAAAAAAASGGKNGSKPGVPTNDDYSKAIDEMMKRIKDGKPLTRAPKQVRRPSCPDETDGSAMNELKGLLTNLKKASSESDLAAPIPADHDDSEFARAFRKIRRPSLEEEGQGDNAVKSSENQTEEVQRRKGNMAGPKKLSVLAESDESTE
ncbi:shootin-1-like isoform X2 [Pomacea canaliculata]|uniref:shootin-1-like isoform X2 n=1 Tax=Pomacea canaliculata TaxID=400727 RepID=UPI000D73B559|nr:shootin-1-like isoform X2 [Pomacea canaliculata]